MSDSIKSAERYLQQAHTVMSAGRADFVPEEWMLLATLVVQAEDALNEARRHDPAAALPLFASVIEELREVTAGFTDPTFLRSTRAARRAHPGLFLPSDLTRDPRGSLHKS